MTTQTLTLCHIDNSRIAICDDHTAHIDDCDTCRGSVLPDRMCNDAYNATRQCNIDRRNEWKIETGHNLINPSGDRLFSITLVLAVTGNLTVSNISAVLLRSGDCYEHRVSVNTSNGIPVIAA